MAGSSPKSSPSSAGSEGSALLSLSRGLPPENEEEAAPEGDLIVFGEESGDRNEPASIGEAGTLAPAAELTAANPASWNAKSQHMGQQGLRINHSQWIFSHREGCKRSNTQTQPGTCPPKKRNKQTDKKDILERGNSKENSAEAKNRPSERQSDSRPWQ